MKKSTRFYLLFSASVLFVIALGYGFAPAVVLPWFLDIGVVSRDLCHIFRAIMGLYLAVLIVWIVGAFQRKVTRAAIFSEIVFMTGLALGRLLSVLVDGWPSPLLIIGMFLELLLAAWGGRLLKITAEEAQ